MEPIILGDDMFPREDGCGRAHTVTLRKAVIAEDAMLGFQDTLREYGFDGDCAVIYDEHTYAALAGKRPKAAREIVLPPEGLHADEHGVALAEARLGGEGLLVAAGAGTVHDITRYLCAARGLSFVSVPTAASVDGFVSSVAAMTLGGYKVTVPSAAPALLVADLNVIAAAPSYLAASGLGDVLGKYVSLKDWAIARTIAGEYYCTSTAGLMKEAVDAAFASAPGIAAGEREAFGALMKALVLSGVAMQLSGNSRPASGAEHHISHLIELGTPWLPETDALHGEKVGVGTLLALETYRSWIGRDPAPLERAVAAWTPYTQRQMRPVFGPLTDSVLRENAECCLKQADPAAITARWDAIQTLLRALPEPERVRAALRQVKGKTALADLGIDEALRPEIERWSPLVRTRLTFMRLLHKLREQRDAPGEKI